MVKRRISLTIEKDLVKKVDYLIDKSLIKNRSQAFEFLIKEYFRRKEVKKCFILVSDWRNQFRKINDSLLISHNIKKIKEAGIENIFVVTPHEEKFLKIPEIKIIKERERLGNIGALWLCKNELENNENFLTIYENVLIEFDLRELFNFHISKNSIATFVVCEYESEKSRDLIKIRGDRIVEYKWIKNGIKTNISGCGVFVFNEKIYNLIPERKGMLEELLFPLLAKSGNFFAFFIPKEEWREFEE